MNVNIIERASRDKRKIWYYLEWGKRGGQRIATRIFTYAKPENVVHKNHNKEALSIIETKRSQLILDQQAITSGYVHRHKIEANFLDFYADFIKKNRRIRNRSLECSLSSFKDFLKSNYITPIDITENLCERFRNYLLDNYNGETPFDYFMRFKRVLKHATKQNYFRISPAADIKSKAKPSAKKDILEADEYFKLINSYCPNYEVKKAVVFCLYTGLRWRDVKALQWNSIKEKTLMITQNKTDVPLEIPLHPIARDIIGERKEGKIFRLPTQNGANDILKSWVKAAGLGKRADDFVYTKRHFQIQPQRWIAYQKFFKRIGQRKKLYLLKHLKVERKTINSNWYFKK